MAQQQTSFWNQDVGVLVKQWLEGVWTLTQVIMLFSMLALPVIVPGLLMWLFQIWSGRP